MAGIRIRTNAVGSDHKMPNNGNGNPSLKVLLLTHSRRIKGMVNRSPISAGVLVLEAMSFMMVSIK